MRHRILRITESRVVRRILRESESGFLRRTFVSKGPEVTVG
jgi:hypothetical protein